MVQVRCLGKIRGKHDKIIGYKLIDSNGLCREIEAEPLKKAIHEGKISVINLTLTSDKQAYRQERGSEQPKKW